MILAEPRQIECLACSAVRVVFGTGPGETGACECCGYVGWTYAEDLDWMTTRMIMNGMLARPASPHVLDDLGLPGRTVLGSD